MKNNAFNVGIIGTGRVGIYWHLPDIREAGGQVVGLSDSVPGRAARFAAEQQVEFAFDDWRKLVEHPEIPIISICTPPHVHEEIAIAALEAGKHVYLEKPPAMNADEMRRITEAAGKSDKVMFVGSNSIYYPENQALKRSIDAGEFGTIYYIEALKTWRRNYKKGWHRTRKIGGGGVGMDSCPHRLDLILYLLGNPAVVSVTARTYDHFMDRPIPPTHPAGYLVMDVQEGLVQAEEIKADVEDTLIAFIQLDNGCTIVLRDTALANMEEKTSMRIFGTGRGAELDPLIYYGEEDGIVTDTKPHIAPRPKGFHVLAWRHFFDCVKNNKPTWSPPERAVRVMEIVDAIYESAENNGKQVILK